MGTGRAERFVVALPRTARTVSTAHRTVNLTGFSTVMQNIVTMLKAEAILIILVHIREVVSSSLSAPTKDNQRVHGIARMGFRVPPGSKMGVNPVYRRYHGLVVQSSSSGSKKEQIRLSELS